MSTLIFLVDKYKLFGHHEKQHHVNFDKLDLADAGKNSQACMDTIGKEKRQGCHGKAVDLHQNLRYLDVVQFIAFPSTTIAVVSL